MTERVQGEGQDPKPANNNSPETTDQNTPQTGHQKPGTAASSPATPATSPPGTPEHKDGKMPENNAHTKSTPSTPDTSASKKEPTTSQIDDRTSIPGTPESPPTSVPNKTTPKVEVSSIENDKDISDMPKQQTGGAKESSRMGNGGPPKLVLPTGNGITRDSISPLPSTPGSPNAPYLGVLDNGDCNSIPAEELEPEEPNPFRLFTPESYERLIIKEEEDRRKALEKKNRPAEGRLVDGELKFDDEEDDGPPIDRDPLLLEGNTLPDHLAEVFPSELYTKPVEDVDQYIKAKTFLVITKRFKKKYIHRFSATKSFFCLAPWNPLRRCAVYIATNQIFDYFIILTILVNCVFLALPESNVTAIAEYVFLAIYTVEAIVKLLARGFILSPFTYLRDAWNWLDFIVILTAYFTIILEATGNSNLLGNITGLRTFRVLRALKTVSIVPGLKTIISALLRSMRMLADVILLTSFCMMVFALFALQVYIGVLRQKCVKDYAAGTEITHWDYAAHIKDPNNWLQEGGEYKLCGNATGAGGCPTNYTCLPDIGPNPNFGYTNFDHFGYSMLSAFQLITLDFWENVYNAIIRANGPWNVIFFGVVVFFGSFYLINLMLAVVSMSYEEEATNAGKEEKSKKDKKKEKKELVYDTSKIKEKLQAKSQLNDAQEKDLLNGSQTPDTSPNHLQIMAPLDGSNSTSTPSLVSVGNNVGNGHIKNPSVRDEAKLDLSNDESDGGKSKNSSPSPGSPSVAQKANLNSAAANGGNGLEGRNEKADTKRRKSSDNGLAVAGTAGSPGARYMPSTAISPLDSGNDTDDNEHKDGDDRINPLATLNSEDTDSIASSENTGDAPVIIVRGKDEDEELVDRNFECCGRCCVYYIPWLRLQNALYRVVSDIIFELFITLCIMLNVLAMAIEHYDQPATLESVLTFLNYVFTGIFILECVLKLCAMGPHFFRSSWNIFDLIIVIASIIDLGVEDINGLSILRVFRLLRLLRVFKLAQTWSTMRVLLAIVIRTLGALGNLTFILVIVMYIFAVIGMQLFQDTYTVDKFAPDEKPRWNFDDFWHSLILIFRVLCGEWIEPLWDCMRANGEICMIVFLPTLVFGNFVVLNLFLALMLNSFASDSLSKSKEGVVDDNKMKQGWKKLKSLFKSKSPIVRPEKDMNKKPSLADIIEELKKAKQKMYEEEEKEKADDENADKESPEKSENGGEKSGIEMKTLLNGDVIVPVDGEAEDGKTNGIINNKAKSMEDAFKTERGKFASFAGVIKKKSDRSEIEVSEDSSRDESEDKKKDEDKKNEEEKKAEEAAKENNKIKEKLKATMSVRSERSIMDDDEDGSGEIVDCFPGCCYDKIAFCGNIENTGYGQKWMRLRYYCHIVTESKVFEYFILFIIFASSITLCFEDIYIDEKPNLKRVLYYLNVIFAAIFCLEMLLKWISLGFMKYFTSMWTILDFCIVVISILSLAAESAGLDQFSSFRALRTLRALRPLRAISRWQGMRIVVNALMYAIPSIFNVLLVCLVFWLIFSIAGVQLFGGKFRKCVNSAGERIDYKIVPNRTVCEELQAAGNDTHWVNSKIHFDNVIMGYLALFQVATFEGWMEVMEDAVDSAGVNMQPRRENSFVSYLFFVIFIIVGSFFTLNLFIGVIIDNFNMLKKKYEGSYLDAFLTPSQKNYYNTMKKLGNKKPQKTIKRPKGNNKIQGFFFDVAISTKFELAIVVLILLNMCAMAVEHYRQADVFSDALDIVNIIFTTIFTLEALVKIIGLRWHYFRRPWNVFDFIIVVLSIVGVILDDLLAQMFITPTLLRVVRVFRIGRVLRLIKAAKGIRKLLFALVISLPALFNIGMLLTLIMFIYSIFGMTIFGNVKHTGHINDLTNFETFFNSMLLLFRLTTSAGWNDILYPLMNDHNCNSTHRIMPDGSFKEVPNGDCAPSTIAALYMVSYIIITFLIIINMYIAVILENFNQAHEQEEVGITEDDFEMFYVVWERYDPHATQFIKCEHLSDLVSDLEQPLGMPKPNEIALVAFDLPIMEGEKMHCLDILVALVKHVLGTVEESEEFDQLKDQIDEKYRRTFPTRVTMMTISSTMRRKKEDVAARTLQRAWRKLKAQQAIRRITEMAMEAQMHRGLPRSSLSGLSTSSATSPAPSSRRGSAISFILSRKPSFKEKAGGKDHSQAKRRSAGNTLKVPSPTDEVPV